MGSNFKKTQKNKSFVLECTRIISVCQFVFDNIFIVMSSVSRTKAYSSHQGNRQNRSFRIGGSLAEENEVRNFNKARNNKSMAPSMPHRIELPLFFNTPSRFITEKKRKNTTLD